MFITPDHPIILLFILVLCAYLGLLSEKIPYLSRLSSVFVTMFLASFLSNAGLIPHDAQLYDIVWKYFIPLSIPFILMRAHLKTIIAESGPTFTAFIIGAIGTIIGACLAFALVSIGDETWKIIGMFCATYIGGSINYVAVSKVLSLQDHNLYLAGNAADNVTMALYFSVLAIMGSHSFFTSFLKESDQVSTSSEGSFIPQGSFLELHNLILALLISTGIYTLSLIVTSFISINGVEILMITFLSLLFVNTYPNFVKRLIPAETVGFMLLNIFFAVIGASADIGLAIRVAPKIILITFIIVTIHLIWLIVWGKRFKIGLKELIIASNANIGGPATAAAMASSQQWHSLVVPGILCGTLGYAIATFIGTAFAHILERL